MTDPHVDAYIQKAPAFAQPILTELRRRVHAAAPAVEETIKWNAPFFLVDGRIVASIAAFKAHTKFILWPEGMSRTVAPESVDFASVEELPKEKAFIQRIKAVAAAAPAEKSTAAKKPAAQKASAAKKPAAKKLSAAKKKR